MGICKLLSLFTFNSNLLDGMWGLMRTNFCSIRNDEQSLRHTTIICKYIILSPERQLLVCCYCYKYYFNGLIAVHRSRRAISGVRRNDSVISVNSVQSNAYPCRVHYDIFVFHANWITDKNFDQE